MSINEMFDSALCSDGNHAGVFEYDGETAYFYLCDMLGKEAHKVVGAIRVLVGTPDFMQDDLTIRWDATESRVGLFICGHLWAAFDRKTGNQYGGNYCATAQPDIPSSLVDSFIKNENRKGT
jgi:hypothetical protein